MHTINICVLIYLLHFIVMSFSLKKEYSRLFLFFILVNLYFFLISKPISSGRVETFETNKKNQLRLKSHADNEEKLERFLLGRNL